MRERNKGMSMSDYKLMAVGGMADRLSKVTGNSPSIHARQLRTQIRGGALKPATYGGEGPTAAALFDEAGLCRAMVLHSLASLNLDASLLSTASGLTQSLDDAARTPGKLEPADAMAFAIEKIREEKPMYFHLAFPVWPFDEAFGDIAGHISHTSEIEDSPMIAKRAWIVLPLHTLLKPLLDME